jgi:hypothetical protein
MPTKKTPDSKDQQSPLGVQDISLATANPASDKERFKEILTGTPAGQDYEQFRRDAIELALSRMQGKDRSREL